MPSEVSKSSDFLIISYCATKCVVCSRGYKTERKVTTAVL